MFAIAAAVVCATVFLALVYWFGLVAVSIAYYVRFGRLDDAGCIGALMWPVLLFNTLRRP